MVPMARGSVWRRCARRFTCAVLIVVALVGCISAFLVSIGILQLPVERFSPSRIDLIDLPKSIGLFSAYGDMALLISYTMLLTISLPKEDYLFGFGSKKMRALVIFLIMLGLLGCQSRNIVLTLMTAIVCYKILKAIQKRSARSRAIAPGLLLFPIIVLSLTLSIIYSENIVVILFMNFVEPDTF